MAPCAMSGGGWMMKLVSMPDAIKGAVDAFSRAETFTGGSLVLLIVLFLGRRFFVKPAVAWAMLNIALLVMGLSMTDADFAAIVAKPDNVPIVGLLFILGFFTWLATAQAVENDDRRQRGEPPLEKVNNEKTLVWPDLVYTELICMIALTALLIVWAIALQAPLEEPASSVKTPNPSKAPWYFLGLQEMLVYFDPWMAGVVLPSMIVAGLMAIPFLDFNKAGNGYYTIDERRFSYAIFQIGFIEMWVVLIILGTFLRGPNWNFFGPYEYWDAHKVDALNNVDLAQYFWIDLLGKSLPKASPDAAWYSLDGTLATIIKREVFRHYPDGSVFRHIAAHDGRDRVPQVLHPDGFYSLHRDVEPTANDGVVADQDDPALDRQLEVHRCHPRVVPKLLKRPPVLMTPRLAPRDQRIQR